HSGGRALDERVQQVREALTSGRRLHLRYVSASDQITEREVDPLQLLTDSQRWYLLAWCRPAQDVRQFRIDRILTLRALGVAVARVATLATGLGADGRGVAPPDVAARLRARARSALAAYAALDLL